MIKTEQGECFFHIHLGSVVNLSWWKKEMNHSKIILICDQRVKELYRLVLKKLEKDNPKMECYSFNFGEENKTFQTLELICQQLAHSQVDKHSLIVAMGGGVVGDVVGMAAMIYNRGTPFIQIPTTLLAQIDSSVGGKVAINLAEGKNLVGGFYQAQQVIIDPLFLTTLPCEHWKSGMGEVIKTAALFDEKLFSTLERHNVMTIQEEMEEIISQCVLHKASVVTEDFYEKDKRMLLNYGHTFGHAIEHYFHYQRYSHGEAVALGMVIANAIAVHLGFLSLEVSERFIELLKRYELPTVLTISIDSLFEAVYRDKKRRDDAVYMIFLNDIGNPIRHLMSFSLLKEVIKWIYK